MVTTVKTGCRFYYTVHFVCISSLNYATSVVGRCPYEPYCPFEALRGGGLCPRSPRKLAEEMGSAPEVRLQKYTPNHQAALAEKKEGISGQVKPGGGRHVF